MKRYFISHILPNGFIRRYGLSVAGCNFSNNLIEGNLFDKVYSIVPTNVKETLDSKCYDDKRFELVYTTGLRNKGRAFAYIASLWEQIILFRKIPKQSSIWTYNVTSLNVLLLLLLKLFKRSTQINVIVLDYTPSKHKLDIANLYLYIVNKAHGNIRLADSSLFTCSNFRLLPGVVPLSMERQPLINKINNKFLLSGVLNETISQTSLILDVFSRIPSCELHITGFYGNETMIKEYSTRFPNICYHGSVSFEEYFKILHSCSFQLSTRDPESAENKCNFPSKIIEALLHNRIVVSTIQYKQLEGIKYFKVDSTKDSLIIGIEEISQEPHDFLLEYANQGELIKKMFNTDIWAQAMTDIEKSK